MTPSPSPPAMPAMPAELTSGAAETVETLEEIEAYFRKEAAYERENMGAGGSTIALGRWKRYYMALYNVIWDIKHPDRRPALSRQEQPVDKPFPTTTNTPNHSRLVGWLPVRPDGPWEQRWHGSGEDRGDHVFRNGEHVAFFGDKQHDAVSILVHVLNLWEAAK